MDAVSSSETCLATSFTSQEATILILFAFDFWFFNDTVSIAQVLGLYLSLDVRYKSVACVARHGKGKKELGGGDREGNIVGTKKRRDGTRLYDRPM
jgi:hypothetical protein